MENKASLAMWTMFTGLASLAGSGEKFFSPLGANDKPMNNKRLKEINIDVSENHLSTRKDDKYGKGKGSKKLSRSKRRSKRR